MKNLQYIVIILLIISSWIWSIFKWQEIDNKIDSLYKNISGVSDSSEEIIDQSTDSETSYKITLDMWQIFEKELQDYKQQVREGKRLYNERQSSWSKFLDELKKTLQEYDKFIAAEGEFWEKQLRNYDKLLSKNEERFEMLGGLIDEMKMTISDFEVWWQEQSQNSKADVLEGEEEEEEREGMYMKPTRIETKISGRKKYKTYPLPEDEETEEDSDSDGEEKIIRGKISGSGKYKTY